MSLRETRLPLVMEWILLGLSLVSQFSPRRWGVPPDVSTISALGWVLFAVMGLRLPGDRWTTKIAYVASGFVLVSVIAVMARDGLRLGIYPLLLLVNFIRSCLLFPRVGRILMAIFTFGVYVGLRILQTLKVEQFFSHGGRRGLPPPLRWDGVSQDNLNMLLTSTTVHSTTLFGLTLLFLVLLIDAWLSERESRAELVATYSQLKDYALRIEDQATLKERNRIAREIHDALGHSLSAQTIQLNNALLFWQTDPNRAHKFLVEGQRLGLNALQEVRQSVGALRSNPLQDQSLDVALHHLAAEFERTTGISITVQAEGTGSLSSELAAALFRMIQEGLTNIQRHSAATQAKLVVQVRAKLIYVLIEDNGQGFDPQLNTTGFGLQGIRERVEALSGQVHILSQPGSGCKVTLYIPLLQAVT